MGIDTDNAPVTAQQYEILHGGGAEAAEIAKQRLSRRRFLRRSMLAVWGVSTVSAVGGALYFMYPNLASGFGGVVNVGKTTDFKASTPDQFALESQGVYHRPVARTYVIHMAPSTKFSLNGTDLTAQLNYENVLKDKDGSYWIALYQKCVHLGCTVPFRDSCISFKCPCHGSHYNVTGEYLDGPAPRSLDRFRISLNGTDVMVDTSYINSKVARPDDTTRLIPVPTVACS
ncbi:MAG TPA: Rieske 2Fe-2S domain-containing protein [Dictyobacter sp.]|jgi:cytochrome b6-f complex iron-sulfur subunit|nr:Rieske 2Fe-2S domain-containing protein [Dictyobacter sp.]